MALLKGFPPSNTISPTIHIPKDYYQPSCWLTMTDLQEIGFEPKPKPNLTSIVNQLYDVQTLPTPAGLIYYTTSSSTVSSCTFTITTWPACTKTAAIVCCF